MKTFNYFADPGHAWIKCSKDLLKNLGIADQISTWSYMRGNYAYLEEDRDATVLCNALIRSGIDFKFREYFGNRRSRIRKYKTYKTDLTISEN